jgi:ribonuclease Z
MQPIVSTELVNGPFGDPALFLDFRFERRALLFDLGDIAALPAKKILRLSDVFVTHAHMDHFSGFDRLLRICLGRDTGLRLYGPPGIIDKVEHKLLSYTWNRIENYPNAFELIVQEWASDTLLHVARFRSRGRFEREPMPDRSMEPGVLLAEPEFRVRTTVLDHGIPCLGLALEEELHVNIWKNRLTELGIPPGPWLKDLKQAVTRQLPDDTVIRAAWTDGGGEHERELSLGDLKERALQLVPGEKLGYVTDIVYHERNETRAAALLDGADRLFIECVFLDEDAAHGERKGHLTAAQAGRIARAARVKAVTPFHFSPRYLGREEELRAELEHARTHELDTSPIPHPAA